MNQLSLESSPYLLQHAKNPVHWRGWNQESLSEAIKKNQLIVLSIGYSACHWCHVMEHESFENQDVANIMNAHFVNIKVDREERPDVDAVYMKAVQIMTNRGGWPLNVVLLPDGRPVWGGTYFDANQWSNSLEQLQKLYQNNPEKMVAYAEKLQIGVEHLQPITTSELSSDFDPSFIFDLVQKWEKNFDLDYGGMAHTPKFMMPNNLLFLQDYAYQTNQKSILDFVDLSLTKMAFGGLFDTIGGGFSRYSVDERWHIPHFEKMLYDNAQLISLYAIAYKRTKNELYKTIIQKTIGFVVLELSNKEGGYFCALDADSLNQKNELREGAFYVWTKMELQQILKEDFELFSKVFNINEFGFWEENHYILIQSLPLATIAETANIALELLLQKKEKWEQLLFQARSFRSKPRLDDKSLTSWNALMTNAFIDAFEATQSIDYLTLAIKNAAFIKTKLTNQNGILLHSFKNNSAKISGFLDDYCFVINAYIALFKTTSETKWLLDANQLMLHCLEHFFDQDKQLFAFSTKKETPLFSKHFEIDDNVISSSNSVMANNLFRLGQFFENTDYISISNKMLQQIMPTIDYPASYSNWLSLYLKMVKDQKYLMIIGKNAFEYYAKIVQDYHPNITIAYAKLPTEIPILNHPFVSNETQFFWCENKSCLPPTNNFEYICMKLDQNQ